MGVSERIAALLASPQPAGFDETASIFAFAEGIDSVRVLDYSLPRYRDLDAKSKIPTFSLSEQAYSWWLWAELCLLRGDEDAAAESFSNMAAAAKNASKDALAVLALARLFSLAYGLDVAGASAGGVAKQQTNVPPRPTDPAISQAGANLVSLLTQLPHDSAEKCKVAIVCAEACAGTGLEDLANTAGEIARSCDFPSEYQRLDLSLYRADTLARQNSVTAAILWLEDLLANPDVCAYPYARMLIHLYLSNYYVQNNSFGVALEHAESAHKNSAITGSPLAQSGTLLQIVSLNSCLGRDSEIANFARQALQIGEGLGLSRTYMITLQQALAKSLSASGDDAEAVDYAEEVGDWARETGDLDLAREYLSLAAAKAEADQQFIRAAGLYGSVAELYEDVPVKRAHYLRKYAKQLVYSAGEDKESALAWANSVMQEAGDLLTNAESTDEVKEEIDAWRYDKLWIRTRSTN